MKKTSILVAFFCSALLVQAQVYQANLDGLQEVPPNASPGFGMGDFGLTGLTLSVTTGSYQDLLGGASVVSINDAGIGAIGPVLFTLTLDTPGAASGTFSGSGALTAGQVTDLNAGNLYVNVRSQVFPSGEIRGQIFTETPEPGTVALMGLGSLALLGIRRKV